VRYGGAVEGILEALPSWVRILVAVALGFGIWRVGIGVLRSLGGGARPGHPVEPEDVEDLDVFLVCGECGTEFRITRLGELQIPRHCGEPMDVVRRPRGWEDAAGPG
jgi:hypothetical protein